LGVRISGSLKRITKPFNDKKQQVVAEPKSLLLLLECILNNFV